MKATLAYLTALAICVAIKAEEDDVKIQTVPEVDEESDLVPNGKNMDVEIRPHVTFNRI